MQVRQIWVRFVEWVRSRAGAGVGQAEYRARIDDNGLITQEAGPSTDGRTSEIAIKQVQARVKSESLEKIQAGFDKLIGQLEGINEHLDRQVAQHEQLISRIDQLPKLLESFPAVVENQRQMTEQLFGQLKANVIKDQQLLEAIEKIPAETARQTDALGNIDHQLAAAADADAQMAETFNKFNETLGALNDKTTANTDGLSQMTRTFAASDRYLKYIVTKQNRLLMWVFISAVGVCAAVIVILVGIIIYLRR